VGISQTTFQWKNHSHFKQLRRLPLEITKGEKKKVKIKTNNVKFTKSGLVDISKVIKNGIWVLFVLYI
jgi:hypothetical protein